jgi:hypothetical protein
MGSPRTGAISEFFCRSVHPCAGAWKYSLIAQQFQAIERDARASSLSSNCGFLQEGSRFNRNIYNKLKN